MPVFSLCSCIVKGDVALAETSKHCLRVCQKERKKPKRDMKKNWKEQNRHILENSDGVTIQLESPAQWQHPGGTHESRLPFFLEDGNISCLDAIEEEQLCRSVLYLSQVDQIFQALTLLEGFSECMVLPFSFPLPCLLSLKEKKTPFGPSEF